MKWNILAVGKPSLAWAKQGCDEYAGRLGRVAQVNLSYVKDGPADQVAGKLLSSSANSLRILMDERGRELRSADLAKWIDTRQNEGCKAVTLIIGGANGHHESLRRAVQESWSLSKFTLQHELALVVLLEQIYRSYSILRGEPYHRE